MIQITNRTTPTISQGLLQVPVLFLILIMSAPVVEAKDSTEPLQPKTLRPPDISSPRDTLRSFKTNMNIILKYWDQGDFSRQTDQAFIRAIETLDLTTTPHSNSWGVRSGRVLLLHEILNRVYVPPDDKIPGDAEIENNTMTEWTIPDTRITIKLNQNGPRAGEFLFSADTVQQLDRLYRHMKQLPNKPGATVGILEEWNSSIGTDISIYKQVRNRLIPVDTSSPRSTLEDFLDSVNLAYRLVMDAEAALKASPPTMTINEATELEVEADILLQRATAALDLSQVPKLLRQDVGLEATLQLKEIFDRKRLPPLDSIPNAQIPLSQTPAPVRWRYPNTEIEIVEIMEGERQGEFLFSARTVKRVSNDYEKVWDLPYRTGAENLDYRSPGKSEGFYKAYISSPGYLIQRIHFLGMLVEALPDWFKTIYGGQTIWKWIGLLLCVLAVVVISYCIYRILNRLVQWLKSPWNYWLMITGPLLVAAIIMVILNFIGNDIKITGQVLAATFSGGKAIIYVMLGWAAFKFCRAVAETIIALPRIHDESIDASLFRLSARVVGALLSVWIVLHGVHKLGVDIVPLVAGLGIGGLTVALAAKSTMANIIGSFMIFADHPYKVGQRIKALGQNGVVESIGLRSTKIRLLSGHLSSIPNEKMASAEIENIGQRPFIRRVFNLGIPYDTPPDKINQATEILRKILALTDADNSESNVSKGGSGSKLKRQDHPNVAINQPNFPPRVYFNEFTDNSLNILIFYWYHPPEHWDYLEHANWINIQIMEQFNAAGIEFAFPTQTLHLAGDEKRPVAVSQPTVSEKADLSRSALHTQSATSGTQTILASQSSASELVRPQPGDKTEPMPKNEKELTNTPLEDHFLHGNVDNEAGDLGGR